jgi:methyl-accepting chemotaxis protein
MASVRTKLIVLTAFFIIDLGIVGALSYFQEVSLIETSRKLATVSVPSASHMGMVDMMHDGFRGNVLAGLLFASGNATNSSDEIRQEASEFAKQMLDSFAELKALPHDQKIRSLVDAAEPTIIQYINDVKTINDLSLAGKLKAAQKEMPAFLKSFEDMERDLGALGDEISLESAKILSESEVKSKSSVRLLLTIITLGLTVGSIVAWYTIRSAMRTAEEASRALLTQANTVGSYASSVDQASKELSRTVENQSRTVQRSATTVHEISEMAKLSAVNAVAVRESSTSAVGVASTGKARVSEMVRIFSDITTVAESIRETVSRSNQQMASVAKVIQEISTKTQVINDIVFQTKLLSFNASVEAARAGEHGKGFAVVAEEVGNLARSSGAAAEEISSMLASSIRNVEIAVQTTRTEIESVMRESNDRIKQGEATAQECDRILDQVVAVSQGVQVKVDQISGAIKEQSIGVEEMSKTLQELETSIAATHQQSLDSAEHSTGMAQAASEMHETTSNLRTVLGLELVVQEHKEAEHVMNVSRAS